MRTRKRASSARSRVGRVSVYLHHGAWWIYYRDRGKQVRRKVALSRSDAQQVAAQVNAQLASGAPTLLAFTPIGIVEPRKAFLAYHENVLQSAVATVHRYRAATKHLEDYTHSLTQQVLAHDVHVEDFVSHLRTIEIAPNGHPNTARRRLRDKGIQFILETCRAMYSFAGKHRYLPPYAPNPFGELPLDKFRIDDAKRIFVFDAAIEEAFFKTTADWAFPLHFTLAKTGLRIGELVHLLIEEVDLVTGWLHVRNKIALGWRIKTGNERAIPLLPEVVAVLRYRIGSRKSGPVFLRLRFEDDCPPLLVGGCRDLERICEERVRAKGPGLTRAARLAVARTVWRDAGAVKADAIRTSFIGTTRSLGHSDATCPKSWRHTFATLLQDARRLIRGVDSHRVISVTNSNIFTEPLQTMTFRDGAGAVLQIPP